MRRVVLLLGCLGLGACGAEPDEVPPEPDVVDPPSLRTGLFSLNELSVATFPGGVLRAIPTNSIPTHALVLYEVPTGNLPAEALTRSAIPERFLSPNALPADGVPPEALPLSTMPASGLYIQPSFRAQGIPAAGLPIDGSIDDGIDVNGGVYVYGNELGGLRVFGLSIDGVSFDPGSTRIDNCRLDGVDASEATLMNVDLSGADLNRIVVRGIDLDGFDLSGPQDAGIWVSGVSAASITCECESAGSTRVTELENCLAGTSAPYDLSARVTSTAAGVTAPSGYLWRPAALSFMIRSYRLDENGDVQSYPFCPDALPLACDEQCDDAWGECQSGVCALKDYNRSGTPGLEIDGEQISAIDEYLRFSLLALFKVAYHGNVRGILSCPGGESFELTGQVGVAGLIGTQRWTDSTDPLVLEQERWFTGTFMALTNVWHQHVEVSLRHPRGGAAVFGDGYDWPEELRPLFQERDTDGDGATDYDEADDYPLEQLEGVYYGNYFANQTECDSGGSHSDCPAIEPNNAGYANFIRTQAPPRVTVFSFETMQECADYFNDVVGIPFDPDEHWLQLGINVNSYWCVLEPRTCASAPVIAGLFCPFWTNGTVNQFCTATDSERGYDFCRTDSGADWPETVSVYLNEDAQARFRVGAEKLCRAINRQKIAVNGCDAPGLDDCDGDSQPDGCSGSDNQRQ